jgi:hypothetical protein
VTLTLPGPYFLHRWSFPQKAERDRGADRRRQRMRLIRLLMTRYRLKFELWRLTRHRFVI